MNKGKVDYDAKVAPGPIPSIVMTHLSAKNEKFSFMGSCGC